MDAAKAIAILLVVLMHAQILARQSALDTGWVAEFVAFISVPLMPLFFLLSGLFARAAIDRSWAELWEHRVAGLVWVFLLWQPAVLVYKLAESAFLPGQPAMNLAEQVVKFGISPLRPNGELWFLWALALFLIAAKLLRPLPTSFHVGGALVVSALWMTVDQNILPPNVLRAIGAGWEGVFRDYGFFLIGVFGRTYLVELLQRKRHGRRLLVLVFWGATYWTASTLEIWNYVAIEFVVSAAGVAACIVIAEWVHRSRWITYIGGRTLPVYVAHMVLIVAGLAAVHAAGWWPTDGFQSAALIVGISIAAVSAALLAFRWTEGTPFAFLYEAPQAWRTLSVRHRAPVDEAGPADA